MKKKFLRLAAFVTTCLLSGSATAAFTCTGVVRSVWLSGGGTLTVNYGFGDHYMCNLNTGGGRS